MGVFGLRSHLNSLTTSQGGFDPSVDGGFDNDDEDRTMTGMGGATAMMGAAVLNADDEDVDADGDEELEDAGGSHVL
jgi:hypothetical protein